MVAANYSFLKFKNGGNCRQESCAIAKMTVQCTLYKWIE